MGQEDIMKILKNDKYLSSGEICQIVGSNKSSIHRALMRLVIEKKIKVKKIGVKVAYPKYKTRHSMKIYCKNG